MSRILLEAGTFFYVGPGMRADRHAHHAVQVVWAADGAIELSVGRRRTHTSARDER